MENFLLNPTREDCQKIKPLWRDNIPSALKSFDLPNAVTYLDAANGNLNGWRANGLDDKQKLISQELINTSEAASPLMQFPGVAVNVSWYNSWSVLVLSRPMHK